MVCYRMCKVCDWLNVECVVCSEAADLKLLLCAKRVELWWPTRKYKRMNGPMYNQSVFDLSVLGMDVQRALGTALEVGSVESCSVVDEAKNT